MSKATPCPCPHCGERRLEYDGIVRWRSGPRPPRSLARPRDQLGFSPRADYDESAYYHCHSCGTEFIDHLVSSYAPLSLQAEGGGPTYVFNRSTKAWQKRER
jgi:DNA-directed RNA polymerase subunit RPC12/RpoP